MRLAIFGGTFDPIHTAHIEIARAARRKFALDRVLFVPSFNPPHKPGGAVASYDHRLEMVRRAIEREPQFEVSEIERGTERSYSIDTIRKVKASYPEARVFFLIGADAYADIRSWHRVQDVLSGVEFIVVARPGYEAPIVPGATVHLLDDVQLPISSTDLRQKLASGMNATEIPQAVASYIEAHRLYA